MNGIEQSEKASADQPSQKPHKTRGPSLKPDTVFQCGNVEGLVSSFQWLVDNATSSLIPDAVTCQFILGVDAVVEIRATSNGTPSFLTLIQKQPESQADNADGKSPDLENPPEKKFTVSVASALAAFGDDAERLKTQRALARAIVEAIQDVDGYRYFEKQVWGTKGQNGCRFRFPCVDSLQNRERAANRYAKAKALNVPVDEFEHDAPMRPSVTRVRAKHRRGSQLGTSPQLAPDGSYLPGLDPAFQHAQPGAYQPGEPVPGAASKPAKTPRKRKKEDAGSDTTPAPTGAVSATDGLDALVDLLQADMNAGPYYQYPSAVNGNSDFPVYLDYAPTTTNGATAKTAQSGPSDPNRVVHKRRKGGCLGCKERRMRCDQAKPACGACVKSSRPCTYEDDPAPRRKKAKTGSDGNVARPSNNIQVPTGNPSPKKVRKTKKS
ncbi:hypothetical protein H2201_002811 [Coniosporium apollinis]|uniref:Zn(2)-C6 fungal-type domain-containing protein n=1 Tax=Coniosporium apollinis TaxID=61459 RepID=A0ABQ9NZ32_9PEZI|nr:hypothetical protein H2201_002811 [Coniosporium apollinis]